MRRFTGRPPLRQRSKRGDFRVALNDELEQLYLDYLWERHPDGVFPVMQVSSAAGDEPKIPEAIRRVLARRGPWPGGLTNDIVLAAIARTPIASLEPFIRTDDGLPYLDFSDGMPEQLPRDAACDDLPAGGWQPRAYQKPVWDYFKGGGKRAVCVWHRRSGKDEFCLHLAAVKAHERPATYWHMLPEAAQARKAIWDAVNPVTGRRRIDEAFPRAARTLTREADMFIRLSSGSTWQVVGSDNYNSLVGTPPIGIVFSEFALADPSAWAYLSPILEENGGWAAFVTTPRGRNHAWRMFRYAERNRPDGLPSG